MLNYSQAYYELMEKLQPIYDAQEASAIAHELMELVTGLSKLQRLTEKDKALTAQQELSYFDALSELMQGKPLQYVLGYAWFIGRKLKVNKNVLIPRPETEELVDWIIKEVKGQKAKAKILDIGTGSGCIPISLKLALNDAEISSCDISTAAIEVAEENAKNLGASIKLIHSDFLDREQWQQLEVYDIIVSNPPYIPINEKDSLHINVREHEPELALFVDSDPQLFYRTIAEFGKTHLKKDGTVYCELHTDHAVTSKEIFEQRGYATELRRDMHGNYRMLKAWFSSSI